MNIFRIVAAVTVTVIAATSLIGCATPTEVKSEAPTFFIESSKDAKTTAACISDKMVAKYHRHRGQLRIETESC